MRAFIHFIYDTCLGFVVKVLGIAMVLSVVVQIACRYLPMTPLRWTEELARLTFIWFCFLGSAMTLSRLKHLTIDFFYLKMSAGSKYLLNILTWVVVIFFSVIIGLYGARLTGIVAMQRSPMLELPMSYFYAAVPVAALLFAVYGLAALVGCLKGDPEYVLLAD